MFSYTQGIVTLRSTSQPPSVGKPTPTSRQSSLLDKFTSKIAEKIRLNENLGLPRNREPENINVN